LTVKLPGPGTLKLQGKAVVNERAGTGAGSSSLARKVKRGVIRLLIKPKGKAKRHLDRSGEVRLKVRISYRPKGGEKGAQSRRLELFER
jgi:hypothetical protein